MRQLTPSRADPAPQSGRASVPASLERTRRSLKPRIGERAPISFLTILLSIALPLIVTGCAGYRVGPVNGIPAGSRAVTVQPFQNNTFEPRLSEAVDFALRRRIQQDGTYRLDTQNDGEILVTGVITQLHREALSFQPNDVITPLDYEMRLVATVTATERLTGKRVFKKEFVGHTTIRASANRDLAERQSEPTMAEDLARNITSALTEGAW
jgi:hypothetical protein